MPRSPRYFLASGPAVHVESSRGLFFLTKLLFKSAPTFLGVFWGLSWVLCFAFFGGSWLGESLVETQNPILEESYSPQRSALGALYFPTPYRYSLSPSLYSVTAGLFKLPALFLQSQVSGIVLTRDLLQVLYRES